MLRRRSLAPLLLLAAAAPFLASLAVTGCDGEAPGPVAQVGPVPSGVAPPPAIAPPHDPEPILAKATYVGRQTCIECHRTEHDRWHGSDHDLAMDHATPETVLADFNDTRFELFGVVSRFFRRDGKYIVHTEGPDGKMADFTVKYVFGVRPLQQYLVEFPGGKVQCLTIAWDPGGRRWFSLYPDERITADDPLHWTRPAQNWNYMCAECHSTNLQKGYDPATLSYQTTWSEIDVSCEACHGPASEHLAWARDKRDDGSALDPAHPKGLSIRLKGADARTQVEMCGRCHSRRRVVSDQYHPGRSYFDHYALETLAPELYHADGQQLDEVYEMGSFLQSKMYHKGVKCTDCHDPHTTRLVAQGNALCSRCHDAKRFDVPEHHRHKPGGEGAACVACHMAEKTYMQVDPRRDHSFQVPRPDLTQELGVPNACNGCHRDQSPAWARAAIESWHGPTRRNDPHFARAFAAAARGDAQALPKLGAVALDPQRPAIVRAGAVSLLTRFPLGPDQLRVAEAALGDPEPSVRELAARRMEPLPDEALPAVLEPLLRDPSRIVRLEAARILSRGAASRYRDLDAPVSKSFWSALQEYAASQRVSADQPGAHLNLAVIAENLGDDARAEQAYRAALAVDSGFVPARVNLAGLLARRDRGPEAVAQLREAVALQPRSPDAHYALGLLLAEDARTLAQAAEHLDKAAALMPNNPRVRYNQGLAHQHLGRARDAEPALLAAHRLAPEEPQYLVALVTLYSQQRAWRDAIRFAERLADLRPGDLTARQTVEQLRRQAAESP